MTPRGAVGQRKHERIAAVLEDEIRNGRVTFGSRLPPESALAARFSVSRNTVRMALSELCSAELVSTRSGMGSFVTFDRGETGERESDGRDLGARHGWAQALQDDQVVSDVALVRLEVVSDPALAAELGMDAADFVAVERVRTVAGGRPISLERSCVPATDAMRDVPLRGLSDGSLTKTLLDAGLVAAHGEQWVEARSLSPGEAEVLDRAAGDVFLGCRRVTRDAFGHLVESVWSVYDPAYFRLHLSFVED